MGSWDKQATTSYPGLQEDTMSINKRANLNVGIFILNLKVEMLGWRDCSVIRGTDCSSKMDWVQFPTPTSRLMTILHPSSRWPDTLT